MNGSSVSRVDSPASHSTARRPILTATVGQGARPRATVIAGIMAGLGSWAVQLVSAVRITGDHADPIQREPGDHLACGRSVLAHLADRATGTRQVALDVATRHLVRTIALVRSSKNPADADFVSELAGEGLERGGGPTMSGRPEIWITCSRDGQEHAISEKAHADGLREGVYVAVCEHEVIATSMTSPAGQPCQKCVRAASQRVISVGRRSADRAWRWSRNGR